jgi:hypothetical protein
MDQNTQPGMTNQQPQMSSSEHSKTKPMIILLTGALVLIIVVLYMFASRTSPSPLPSESIADTTSEVRKVTGTSDDVSSIETDLNTSVTGLDTQNF